MVQNVHLSGGSLLGVSRGGPSVSEIVDSMEVLISFIFLVLGYSLIVLGYYEKMYDDGVITDKNS